MSGWPQRVHVSAPGPGSPDSPSHAGRPPTLLGNCSLRSLQAGAASAKPSSTSPAASEPAAMGSQQESVCLLSKPEEGGLCWTGRWGQIPGTGGHPNGGQEAEMNAGCWWAGPNLFNPPPHRLYFRWRSGLSRLPVEAGGTSSRKDLHYFVVVVFSYWVKRLSLDQKHFAVYIQP